MADHAHDTHDAHSHGHHNPALHEPGVEMHPSSTGTIWRVFWILLGITVAELAIAFTLPKSGITRTLFIVMTLVKAFYIVGYFMHLKFEKVNMILTILVPLLFIIAIIGALLYESNYWGEIRY